MSFESRSRLTLLPIAAKLDLPEVAQASGSHGDLFVTGGKLHSILQYIFVLSQQGFKRLHASSNQEFLYQLPSFRGSNLKKELKRQLNSPRFS